MIEVIFGIVVQCGKISYPSVLITGVNTKQVG